MDVTINISADKQLPFKIKVTGFQPAYTAFIKTTLTYGDPSVHVSEVANEASIRKILQDHKAEVFKNLPSDYNFDSVTCSGFETNVQEQISVTVTLVGTKADAAGTPLTAKITVTGYAPENISVYQNSHSSLETQLCTKPSHPQPHQTSRSFHHEHKAREDRLP